MSAEGSRFRRALREVAVLVFFLAMAVVATRPLAFDLTGQTLPGPDPLIDMWTVHWLTGHVMEPRALFGGNIFHPEPNAVLFSDMSMGTAVLLAPLRPFVRDPVPLYNAGVLLALAFAGWSFCALAREVSGRLEAGLFAGVVAAFGSHQMSHVYHLNLLTTGWLALAVLGLERALRRSWGGAVLAGVSLSLSAQSTGYYAVAAALLGVTFVLVHARALRDRGTLLRLSTTVMLAAALTAPYAVAFFHLRERESETLARSLDTSRELAFVPERDLGSRAYIYRRLLGAGEEQLFPGLLILLFCVASLRSRPREGVYYGLAAAVLLLISLGPELSLGWWSLPLPYRWLFEIPPFDSMRHPFTFAAVATFMLSVLAALGWARSSLSRRAWAGPLLVLLAVVETLGPPVDVRRIPSGLPPIYELWLSLPPGPALEVPFRAEDVLLWAARHGKPVVNGDGAFGPTRSLRMARLIRNHWVNEVPEDLDTSKPMAYLREDFPDLRYVIVPTGRREKLDRLAQAFDRSSLFVKAGESADGDRIYELRRSSS